MQCTSITVFWVFLKECTPFRIHSHLVTASKDMMLLSKWSGREEYWARPMESEYSQGWKSTILGKRISSLPYQAKHHWYSLDVWEGENCPSINSMICLHLVLTENKPSIHWQNVSFNSLRWIYFKRKLPIFISLNLRGKVHADFSSLKY